MDQEDILNISQWLQQILKDLQDTHIQTQDMRGEMRAVTTELKAANERTERHTNDVLKLIEAIRAQTDVLRGDFQATQSHVDSKIGGLEVQIKDLKSEIASLRNTIR